ncbi:MAG TPA: C4-type zinc ribbon domain-containing protein, partial [Rariglobus sp.]
KVERERLAASADAAVLPLYERLLKTKGGVAIAPMHEGKCGGCHMKLVASTVIKVQAGRDVAQCEDCGRILYAD